MSDWTEAPRNTRNGVTIPTIRITVVLSILVHIAALWLLLPRLHLLPFDSSEQSEPGGRLTVQLAPLPSSRPATPSSPALQEPPPPPPRARPPKATRPKPSPPVIALKPPAPDKPVPPPAAPAPPPAPSPVIGDMASFIEARRRARGETAASSSSASSAQSAESDDARRERIVAANLASQRPQTFGYDPSQGGGMFQIVRMAYDNADFLFFGWNREIQRKTKQLIEVRQGSNSDIRIAVIRKMIAIIREHEQEDFLWESPRLGRNVMLSARSRDNAGLENFLMSEFFPGVRLPQ